MYSIKIVLFYFFFKLRLFKDYRWELQWNWEVLCTTHRKRSICRWEASSVKISFGSFSPKKRICTHVYCRYAKYVTVMHNVVHLGPCKHRSNFTCDELDGNEQKLSRYYRVRRMWSSTFDCGLRIGSPWNQIPSGRSLAPKRSGRKYGSL